MLVNTKALDESGAYKIVNCVDQAGTHQHRPQTSSGRSGQLGLTHKLCNRHTGQTYQGS